MSTWRISTSFMDKSIAIEEQIGSVGASVIRSQKGPTKPIKIYAGQEQRIIHLFGKPSATYPDVWDAIEYNKNYDMWLAAPDKNGKHGGVWITQTGSEALTSGLSSDSITFSAIPIEEDLGTGDNSSTTFTTTVTEYGDYVNQSIDIEVGGTSISLTASDAATEVLTSVDATYSGSGTYNRSTGEVSFTFDTAPATSADINVTYNIDRSDEIYFALLNSNKEADDLAVKTTYSGGLWTLTIYRIDDDGNYIQLDDSPYTVSLTAGSKDGFGKSNYILDVFDEHDYIKAVINSDLSYSSFVDDSDSIDMAGGSRGDTVTIAELTTSWNYFQDTVNFAADVFFDCTAVSGVETLFNTLRNTYQKYSIYLLNLGNVTAANAVSTKDALSINNAGLAIYWSWFKIRDIYNNSFFYSACMGRIASKHAAMSDVYNGLAPSWIDENSHGGQLGPGILEQINSATETQLQTMDSNQINPVIKHPSYGYMIVSQKTAQTTLSDYSYIGHIRLRDYLVENIINNALYFQITKLNDTEHRNAVKSKADLILSGPLGLNLLVEAEAKCDNQNNNADVLNRREFILDVAVKFTTFSEKIKFNFINTDQGTSVSEVL